MSDASRRQWRYMDAVRDALAVEMRADPTVFLAGTDVAAGGVFGVTKGLLDEFGPSRIRDTPITEMAVLGLAVGAAMAGYRPVVELMFMDFLGVAFDPLLNQAAKLRYMTGGALEVPMVVRTQTGAGRSAGAQHSQSLEALVAHVPGLKVVMPATVEDAAALLRGAIRDPHPVVYVENRRLYGTRIERTLEAVPDPEALGAAAIRRSGEHLTIVTWSRMVQESLAAAETLADEGISLEVVDLRSLVPMDLDTILGSVRRTGRLLVVHEAVEAFGAGAEVLARVTERAWAHLSGPPRRIGGRATPIPFSPPLEAAWLPDASSITSVAREMVG